MGRDLSPGSASRRPSVAGHRPDPARSRRRRLRPGSLRLFLAASTVLAACFDAASLVRRARRGPWRAEVAEGSMAPALLPGDWLLLDPTCARWPRVGSIVVVREPGSGIMAIKRVAARGARGARGDRVGGHGARGGERGARGSRGARGDRAAESGAARVELPDGSSRALFSREAWVLGDAAGSIDARSYGPLDAEALVARAWFRYGPPRRFGRLR